VRYLVGVGQAESRSGAEEQAYAAVAKIFRTEIELQSKDRESYSVIEDGSHALMERHLALDRATHVTTEKVLENVHVLDAWFDPKNRQYYALAGVDKAQAETVLLERIKDLDATIEKQVGEARHTQDKLAHVRNLKRAAKNLVVREAYNADLRVIRATGQGQPPAYQVSELINELEEFLAGNLAVAVNLGGEQAEPVQLALMEGLILEGLSVTGHTGRSLEPVQDQVIKPELAVTGMVRLWSLDIADRQFTYVRWCADAVIEDVATKRVIGSLSKGGKEGHLTQREAVAKAVRVMQQQFSSELARSLAGYVYGDLDVFGTTPGTPRGCPRDAS
jgi:hypothetical protein